MDENCIYEVTDSIDEFGVEIDKRTPLQEFYAHQCIFITGATGFIGKVLVEKLLRSCFDLKRIYVLVRSKRGKNVAERVESLLNDPIFNRVKAEKPSFFDKVKGIEGDCSLQGLGLSNSDRNLLIRDISIVFHVAATVNFNEKLKIAATINLQSLISIIDLCRLAKNLKSFIQVSSAFSNCVSREIDEKFYDCPIKADRLLNVVQNLPDGILDEISPRIISPWPNTYVFTKSLAESLIESRNEKLPIGIFRPSLVISSHKEPVPGWIDNDNGPTAISTRVALGVMRTFQVDVAKNADLVPVDLTVNALIASAWDVCAQASKGNQSTLIYNFVSSVEAKLTWNDFIEMNRSFNYPLKDCSWYPTFYPTKYKILFLVYAFFLHLTPAVIVDATRLCFGKQPEMLKNHKKITKLSAVLSYFGIQDWVFSNKNVQNLWKRLDQRDKEIFAFSMSNFDWEEYFKNYMEGIRVHFFRDPPESLNKSGRRQTRLYWLHQCMKGFIISFGLLFLIKSVCAVFW